MSESKITRSQSSSVTPAGWTGTQAYVFAAACLLLGVVLGYLFRASASPATPVAAATTPPQQLAAPQQASAEAQGALEQASAPLLEAVKDNPNDYDSLVKLGNLFYDAQQFPNSIQYYERALKIHPDNPDVRTDMGTAYWYAGNTEKAVAAMETSLKYRPGHPQTLFNLGWVRWQGKADPKGAIEAWEQLLKSNPDYPQRQQVEHYIAKAKEHADRG
jgi:cytochrome c-type biogenesis protein CcmH/NrfG